MNNLIGQDKMLSMADEIIKKCDDAACEILFFRTRNGLTRLANSMIHQNVTLDETSVNIRVSRGDKIGVASTSDMTPSGLFDCLVNSIEIMKTSQPLPGFPGPASKAEYLKTNTYCEKTAAWGPAERAQVALAAIKRAEADGLTLAGAIETSTSEVAIANSNGVRAYQPVSGFACNFVAMDGAKDDPPSGYGALTGRDVEKADFEGTYDRACRKAVLARNPIEIEPGQYDVVLEPNAFSELLEWFSSIALSGRVVQDGISPLAGHFGEKITGDYITLIDDAYDGMMQGLPYDLDGVPRQKVVLIDHGVAKAVVHSRYSAYREGVEPTGHGFGPAAMPSQSAALNIRMLPGDKSLEEMVSMLDYGIQVTRFHYVNGLLDTKKAVMTGMTRDGAWLIEKGKIKSAIKNLRFTDSMLEAWKRIEAVENRCHLVRGWWSTLGSFEVPSVLIRKFVFSGKTGKGS